MSTLEHAIALAAQAHAGQLDDNGDPYLLHPLRLMMTLQGQHERMAAVLHDVVEHTALTLEDLRQQGVPEPVVEAVDALSKRPGETRLLSAARAARNPIALCVKLADVADNSDLRRYPQADAADHARMREYDAVRLLLRQAATRTSGA